MARSYYSTIFEQSADDVWNVIRDFNNYAVWVDGAGESQIEADRPGDSVGAIRNVLYNGTRSLFEQAGFTYERRKGMNHCVMTKTVQPR